MARPVLAESVTRKTITLPDELWERILLYRKEEMLGSDAEALRRLLLAALRREEKRVRQ